LDELAPAPAIVLLGEGAWSRAARLAALEAAAPSLSSDAPGFLRPANRSGRASIFEEGALLAPHTTGVPRLEIR
jgi:hypothetical protein